MDDTWSYTNNLIINVKSAYHLHQFLLTVNEGNSSTGYSLACLWNNLWKLKITNGVKMFVWRACKNIVKDDACPICY